MQLLAVFTLVAALTLVTARPYSYHYGGGQEERISQIMRARALRLQRLNAAQSQQETHPHDEEEVNIGEGITGLYEGDIVLTDKQKEILDALEDSEGDVREQVFQGHIDFTNDDGWYAGIVPYVLDSSLSQSSINAIKTAMAQLEDKTTWCVMFIERESEEHYVKFKSGSGCSSPLGFSGGEHVISIQNGKCDSWGIAAHEILHVLGRLHEQNRPDRDSYVTVDYSNIISQAYNDFKKEHSSLVDTRGIGYDYDSIMHYGSSAAAINANKPTITKKDGSKISGQRDRLTSKDVENIIKTYCGYRLG